MKMSGMNQADIARALEVDYKTVNRWINEERAPHTAHRQKLYKLFIEKVDLPLLAARLKKRYKNPLKTIKENPSIYNKFLVSLTYNSDAIEGSTLTESDTERIIIQGDVLANKSQKAQQEAINHKTALEFVFSKATRDFKIDEGFILSLHRMVMHGLSKDAGQLRRVNVNIRGLQKKLSHYQFVPQLFKEFTSDVNTYGGNVIKKTAINHYEFEEMHPFSDGNGRVGRLISITQLLSKNFPPCVIQNKDRERYYGVLQMGDIHRFDPIANFFAESILQGYALLE
ncbi:MAG: Fic family protein [Candidatus Gorgyraea atricola]|nr:Fic family protein [Candidatus Gorgyraea atricola]